LFHIIIRCPPREIQRPIEDVPDVVDGVMDVADGVTDVVDDVTDAVDGVTDDVREMPKPSKTLKNEETDASFLKNGFRADGKAHFKDKPHV
jgi:hypothetical protein